MRILFVEDHVPLAEAVGAALRRNGFVVDLAGSVAEAEDFAAVSDYDLALLDLGLPDGSGMTLLKAWRAAGKMPVIVLTARGGLGDRVEGLDSGADDYVVKPVEMPELVSRCRAVLRRPGGRAGTVLEAGTLRFDTVHRELSVAGRPLSLGRRELAVLEALMRRKNRVLPRRVVLDAIYDREAEVTPNAVDAAVSRLRRALCTREAGIAMETVRGVGWILLDEAEQ